MGNLFDSFMGLPVHPLVDHFAVVLFPLALLMLLAIVAVRPWRARFGWLTMGLLVAGTAAVLAAKESGERLAARMGGAPRDHQQYADILLPVAIATLVVALVWFVVDRGAHLQARRASASEGQVNPKARPAPSAVRGILAGLTVVTSIASLVLVILVGHTGSKAAWGGVGTGGGLPAPTTSSAQASQTPSASGTPSASDTPSGTDTPSASAPGGSASTATATAPSESATPNASSSTSSSASTPTTYTLAQVAQHHDASDCWVAINGNVYNLTQWINQHPGGPEKITQVCGTDGSGAFNAQHANDQRPHDELQQFLVGKLG